MSPALAGEFFYHWASREALLHTLKKIKLSNLTIHCIEAHVFISKIKASVSYVYAYEAEGPL